MVEKKDIIITHRPVELKELETFTVQLPYAPYYEEYISLCKPEPDHGYCECCAEDVLLFRIFEDQKTCYYCYVKRKLRHYFPGPSSS